MSRSCRPVTSGAPSEMTRSTGCSCALWTQKRTNNHLPPPNLHHLPPRPSGNLTPAFRVVIPSSGAMGCRSMDTILTFFRGFNSELEAELKPRKNVKIVSIDLQPMAPLEGITTLKADITHFIAIGRRCLCGLQSLEFFPLFLEPCPPSKAFAFDLDGGHGSRKSGKNSRDWRPQRQRRPMAIKWTAMRTPASRCSAQIHNSRHIVRVLVLE
jgi:hypothetical protein